MLALLELAETGRLLDERPPILRLRCEDGVDLALRDDRVHRAAEPDVGQELHQVGAAHGSPVDEVLALAAADEPARDRDLREVELAAEATVGVVEEELHLAMVGRRVVAATGEQHVVGLLRAERRRRQRARGPDDRVGDVRLARAVRADDHGHARLELHLDGIRERLEAAQLDAPQMHASATLPAATDGMTREAPLVGASRWSSSKGSGRRPSYFTVTLTDAVCVVGRPLVFSTILNCAVPLVPLIGIESTVDLPAATFTAAFPLTVPLKLAVAET